MQLCSEAARFGHTPRFASERTARTRRGPNDVLCHLRAARALGRGGAQPFGLTKSTAHPIVAKANLRFLRSAPDRFALILRRTGGPGSTMCVGKAAQRGPKRSEDQSASFVDKYKP